MQVYGQPIENKSTKGLRFIEEIEIVNGEVKTRNSAKNDGITLDAITSVLPVVSIQRQNIEIEKVDLVQIKYALVLDTEIENLKNQELYSFIEKWMGTPYRYGAKSESGTDCSGFSGILHQSIFGVNLPRTAKSQFQSCDKIKVEEIREGDLVFFNTRGGVSHVGVYLHNGYFVHASTKDGVRINNLNDDYYKNRFLGGGRPSICN
jgi:lipoprotein Spr